MKRCPHELSQHGLRVRIDQVRGECTHVSPENVAGAIGHDLAAAGMTAAEFAELAKIAAYYSVATAGQIDPQGGR